MTAAEHDNPNNGNRYDNSAAVVIPDLQSTKQRPPASADMRAAAAKEYRDARRAKNRKERRAALAEVRKVERGDYR